METAGYYDFGSINLLIRLRFSVWFLKVNGTIKQNVYITLSVTTTAIMLINLQGVRLIFDSSCQVGIYCCFRVCFLIYLVRILIKQEKKMCGTIVYYFKHRIYVLTLLNTRKFALVWSICIYLIILISTAGRRYRSACTDTISVER